MILNSSNYPFNGAVSELSWPGCILRVTTAKDGFFSKQSTVVKAVPFEGAPPSTGYVVGKLMWSGNLGSEDRQRCHHEFVRELNMYSTKIENEGLALHPEAQFLFLEAAVQSFQRRGLIKSFIQPTA